MNTRILNAVIAVAAIGVLIAIVVMGGDFLALLAPFTGSAWSYADIDSSGGSVDSPYGEARVTYDDFGVPHIEADNTEAAVYAAGYVHARDRLFQMDLQRRLMSGTLSEALGNQSLGGETTVESDEFHRKMDFMGAANASYEVVQSNHPERANELDAYTDGVNKYIEENDLPFEFQLLGYEPREWRPVDSLLIGKAMAWTLTGGMGEMQRMEMRNKLGEDSYNELYPEFIDHGSPIIRGEQFPNHTQLSRENASVEIDTASNTEAPTGVISELSRFTPGQSRGIGSNNWMVGGEYTESGEPILANDPHLLFMAPSLWYEARIQAEDIDAYGFTLAGVPLVVIGGNQDVAWGFTNTGVDVLDLVTYKVEGDRYLYEGEMREFETSTEVIKVSGEENREVEVRKTVHGPYMEVDGEGAAVRWTGLTGTREAIALYHYNTADDLDEFLEGMRFFDIPGQNVLVIDSNGDSAYYPYAKYPIRYTGDEMVRGDVVLNGSRGEGEWRGFTPYGESSWDGFIPFEEVPHVINPDYIGSANQRIVDERDYYLGDTPGSVFRGVRLYEELDRMIREDTPITREDMKDIQTDIHSSRAELLAPIAVEYMDDMPENASRYAERLEGWSYEMDRDSRAAPVYFLWAHHFKQEAFSDDFDEMGVDGSLPSDWVLANLDEDSRWFDDVSTDETESRGDIAVRAMEMAVDDIEENDVEVWGDIALMEIEHPFGGQLGFLNYPAKEVDGSGDTLHNVWVEEGVAGPAAGAGGSSMYFVHSFDGGNPETVIPGGQSGHYFSRHYGDQLDMWVDNEMKEIDMDLEGDPDLVFG